MKAGDTHRLTRTIRGATVVAAGLVVLAKPGWGLFFDGSAALVRPGLPVVLPALAFGIGLRGTGVDARLGVGALDEGCLGTDLAGPRALIGGRAFGVLCALTWPPKAAKNREKSKCFFMLAVLK